MRMLLLSVLLLPLLAVPPGASASSITPEQLLTKKTGHVVRYPREVRVAQRLARLVGTVVLDWRYVNPRTLLAEVPGGHIRVHFPRDAYPTFEIVF